ncbi:hypothetical protein SprV_0902781700 [Sparganum proliferum]
MGLITLAIGCALISSSHLPYGTTFPGYYAPDTLASATLEYATGVGLLILGILFFVWFAILTGCTICLRTAYKDEPNAPQSHWIPVVRGWRICTVASCILLPLLAVACLTAGAILVSGNYFLHIAGNCFSERYSNYYCRQAMDAALTYAGGAGLVMLAVIFFLWSAILTGCTVCLRSASKEKLNTPQAKDESSAEYVIEPAA